MSDPAAAVLGALVTGALRLPDVAGLPPEAIPGEVYPVILDLLRAQEGAGRRTQGVRLADARAALAVVGAGEDATEALVLAARGAPKRREALRAVDELRARYEATGERGGAVSEEAEIVGELDPEPVAEAEPAEAPAMPPEPETRLAPFLSRALPGSPWEARAPEKGPDIREVIAAARAAWEKPRTVAYGGAVDLRRGEARRY